MRKIKMLLKRIMAVFGASLMLAIPSSEAYKKESKGETQKEEEKITDEYKETSIPTQRELEKIIETEEKNNKESEKKIIQQVKPSEKSNTDLVYSTLLEEFNNEIEKKDFSDLAVSYLKGFLDNVYKNYDDWYQTSKDLPDKETYIRQEIISVIPKINNFYCYANGTEEYNECRDENTGDAFTDINNNITVLYDKNCPITLEKIEEVGHELKHANSNEFNSKYYKEYDYLRFFIPEGGATSAMKYSKPLTSKKSSSKFIEVGDYCLEYKNDNGEGYPMQMNIYNNLMYLIGYDNMRKVSSKETDISIIKDTIETKYGSDIAEDILKELKHMKEAYDDNNNINKMKSAIKLQKSFLECKKKEIQNLKNKDEIEKYINVYRAEKFKNTAQIYKNDVNITNQYFNFNELDELLTQKALEVNAYKIGNSKEENENALMCLLYASIDKVDDNTYMPVNLNNVKIEYKNGKLEMNCEKENSKILLEYSNGKVITQNLKKEEITR